MIVGIVSDSHDNQANLRSALAHLHARKAELLIHLGDLCEVEMLNVLAEEPNAFSGGIHFIWGNNDFDHAAMRARAKQLKITCHNDAGDLTLAGKRIFFCHGHFASRMEAAIAGGQYDYVLHGHTHKTADSRQGRTRIINPGALQRATPKTCAILDTATDTLEWIQI